MKKVFSTIKHFIVSKKVASAVIGVAMIGGVSAAGIVSSNLSNIVSNASSNNTASTMSVLDTSSVSSEVSSEVSSAVSSALSSAPDVQTQDVSSSTVSTVDNTDARNAALQGENDRHTQALTDIDALYDPQITALQTEIAGFQAEGVTDKSAEMEQAKQIVISSESGAAIYQTYLSNPDNDYCKEQVRVHPGCELDYMQTNKYNTLYGIDKPIQDKYDQMQKDQSQLTTLQTQKQSAIDSENLEHTTNLIEIQANYS